MLFFCKILRIFFSTRIVVHSSFISVLSYIPAFLFSFTSCSKPSRVITLKYLLISSEYNGVETVFHILRTILSLFLPLFYFLIYLLAFFLPYIFKDEFHFIFEIFCIFILDLESQHILFFNF